MSKSFKKKLSGKINRFEFEVGVLENKPHNEPQDHGRFEEPKLTSYAGGPVRKQSRQKSEKDTGEILVENMKRLNINLLLRPFQETSSDILKFTKAFLSYALDGKSGLKRVENLLQAVVRNPILKKEYGQNKAPTADAKGFDRHLFDTGQMFKAIKAKVKRV